MCETRCNKTNILTRILSALEKRRLATSYSTSYHHNEHVLTLCHSILTNQPPIPFLLQNPSIPRLPPPRLSSSTTSASAPTALLYRIVANATAFSTHYRAQVAALQARQGRETSMTGRCALATRFESGHWGGEDGGGDVGAVLAAKVMERRGAELEGELQRFVCCGGAVGGPLGSHPVRAGYAGWMNSVPEFKLVVEEEVVMEMVESVEEGEKDEMREEVIEGVDGDMIVAFWEKCQE